MNTDTATRETYAEMKKRHADEIGRFPMGFAFSEKQLSDVCARLCCCASDLAPLFAGAFIRRKDLPAWEEMETRHASELDAGLARYDFARAAFCSEFANHETAYTCDAHDALASLGIVRRRGQAWIEAIPGDETRRALLDACRECEVPRWAVGA